MEVTARSFIKQEDNGKEENKESFEK